MNLKIPSLVDGYLDETLSENQEMELINWLKSNPANAIEFAALIQFHNRLHDVVQIEKSINLQHFQQTQIIQDVKQTSLGNFWNHSTFTAGIAGVFCLLSLVLWGFLTSNASATYEIERLANSASSFQDRTYRIISLDNEPEMTHDRQPGIDGATLHVKQPDKYVLIRKFPDNRLFITGSDGSISWAIPPDGAVRVSSNATRFMGSVPGNQHGIPFINLRSDLTQLKTSYNLDFLSIDKNGLHGISATKKSAQHRGPKKVEFWYDQNSGLIKKMIFTGMPQAKGGPANVSAELVDNNNPPMIFFNHESHHLPDRKIIEEN